MSLSWWSIIRPRNKHSRRGRSSRPCLEVLEDRTLPAVFTVNTALDVLGHTDSQGHPQESLRQAIIDADSSPGADVIQFSIASGQQTINVGSTGLGALPALFDAVTIDGTTQPGFAGTPLIELNGSQAGSSAAGLTITAANTTVRGLVINRFGGSGITLSGSSATGDVIAGNYIGTDVSGLVALANGAAGVDVEGAFRDTIGGTAPGTGNVLSGNGTEGVLVVNASGILIEGNLVGTDATGKGRLGNGAAGLLFSNANNGTVGGTSAAARNVISANTSDGILLTNGSHEITVEGNYIGTDASGSGALDNVLAGVFVGGGAYLNRIGTSTAGAGNVISGNGTAGIYLTGSGLGENTIQGNYIGTNATGSAAVGNEVGVAIINSAFDSLGGSLTGMANVISGNSKVGVYITGANAGDNRLQGNRIGTQADGTSKLGNGLYGVFVSDATSLNTIGGPVAGAGNTIAFNGAAGVLIGSDPTLTFSQPSPYYGSPGSPAGARNTVEANSIYANGGLGIDLGPDDGVTPNHSGAASGPNNFQNFPVITSVVTASGVTTVQGTLTSTANTTFRIELFASAAGDPSGFGQGQTFLVPVSVTTDGSGNASFSASVTLPAGKSILTATATDSLGNTSEFSQWNATTTTLTTSVNPSVKNQPVTFTAKVAALEPGAGVPAGTVSFLDGSTVLDTEKLDSTGQAAFTTSTLSVGTHSLTAVYSGTLAASTSSALSQTVNAFGDPSKLAFTAQPATTTAGQVIDSPGGVQVTVEDAFGNVVATDNSTVTLTLSGAFANGASTATAQAINGVATFANLVIDTADSYTLAATDGTLAADTSASFTISPDVASKVVFTGQPSNTTAGQAISPAVTVAVEDQFGNLESTDASTVTLTLSSGTFANGASTASAQASGGVATLGNLVIDTAGNYTLAATDSTLAADTSALFTISPDVVSKVVFTGQPSSTTAGQAISPAVTVAVEDKFGNLETNDASMVTLTLSSSTFANGSGTATAQAAGGVAAFGNLVIDIAGNYTLAATDGTLASDTSASFTVSPDTASKVVFTGQPTNTTAGQVISPAVTVAVEDQFGNLERNDDSTVTLTLSSGTFSNSARTASAQASGGVATFGNLVIDIAGSYTLAATDGTLTADTSAPFPISPDVAKNVVFTGQPSNTTAGQAISPAVTVAVEDQFGNLETNDASTVTLTLSSGTFANGTNTAAAQTSGGVATFGNLVIDTAGNYTLAATDGTLTGDTSSPFRISPDVASKLVFQQAPGSVQAGQAATVSVAVEDRFSNVVTGDTSPVTLTLSGPGPFVGGGTTVTVRAAAGIASFTKLVIDTAGGYSLKATDASLASASASLFVTPAPATHFSLTAPASATPGLAFSLTVTALDPFGNTDTNYAGTVHFASTDSTASLPADGKLPGGTGTFRVVLNVVGLQTITATDLYHSAVPGSTVVTVGAHILLLDPTGQGALTDSGNGQIVVAGGGSILVDSSSPAAVSVSGNGSIRAREMDVVGTPGVVTSGQGAIHGTVHSGAAPLADPLASLPAPAPSSATFAAARYSGQAVVTLRPGTYVGGIHLSGEAAITLLPGIYYLQGGGLSISGKASLAGDGVLIYNAPRSSADAISLTGQGSVKLTPMSSGVYRGITLFQDRTSTAPLTITGNGNLSITGTLYAARAALSITGNGGLNDQGDPLDTIGSQYVCYDLHVTGNGGFGVRLAPV